MEVQEAIDAADAVLPGEPVDEGTDPRWQAIIRVGEFIESDPEPVWRFICRWGGHTQEDLRDAVATCLLEHLLEYHFDIYFPQVEQVAVANPLFGDTFLRCWQFGQADELGNAEWFRSLAVRLEKKLVGAVAATKMMLTDHEVGVLLAGTRMNWGFPFAFAQPHKPDAVEQEVVDAVVERFQGVRRENHEQRVVHARELDLSAAEASALLAVLQACLAECRGNSTSIHLHLQAEDEAEVRSLVDRLQAWRGAADP